ncbi:cytochrome c biogenesis protein DipZ [Humibacter sp. RRB41]|uniref:cytochrome c biogenesis protein DipZ n=1 Tax=Humibacter sp. RRB41 TaxID=2919946 RepID=UPI0027E336D7|nr:cytochrome c biogenesis protein DipZ [Humibacter sp. RRB41]
MYLTLALIGFLGGLITGISPCILPVLPVIFFSGGVQSSTAAIAAPVSRWRPYQVILGLVVSFSVFTLLGSLLLALLHLPQDVLRYAGIAVLLLIGVGLIVPRFEAILEKPFSWIPQRNVGTNRGGFVLGIALGAVYVPCAGPVLAAITVAGSTGRIGPETIVLTLTFAIGAAIPLLIFALAGRGVANRVRSFRKYQKGIRLTGGVLMIALAVALALNLPQLLQTLVPDYTASLQNGFSNSKQVSKALDLGGIVNDQNKNLSKCRNDATSLESCGTAPDITGIQQWFNTPGDRAVTLKSLRGKVVLVDFWAYSCINCQRSVPHVVAWNKAYAKDGLQVIGIHSPEYAFEKVVGDVKAGANRLGITYPVAIDNNLSTWTNYRNRYWPAHYLIDAKGVVRNVQFGEGDYASTEAMIRTLLKDAHPGVHLPPATNVKDTTPTTSTTAETYLGTTKQVNYSGQQAYSAKTTAFTLPSSQPKNTFALDGRWSLHDQYAQPRADDARIRLAYTASRVQMVLGGSGTVTVRDGASTRTVHVSGVPREYTAHAQGTSSSGTLIASVSPGVEVYSFTFG